MNFFRKDFVVKYIIDVFGTNFFDAIKDEFLLFYLGKGILSKIARIKANP